jgi:hypothetical protein
MRAMVAGQGSWIFGFISLHIERARTRHESESIYSVCQERLLSADFSRRPVYEMPLSTLSFRQIGLPTFPDLQTAPDLSSTSIPGLIELTSPSDALAKTQLLPPQELEKNITARQT